MIVIGITGGMASGKSTVARMFAGRGIFHIDADQLVHHLMRHDRATRLAIAEAFPNAVKDERIDRAVLADTISKHPEKLKLLEQILHPRVRDLEVNAIHHARRRHARALILDIPLLFETDAHALCDVTISVRAKLGHRKYRAFARPGMNEEKWQKLLARQLTDAERNQRADLVIHTSLGKAATRRLVQQWQIKLGLC